MPQDYATSEEHPAMLPPHPAVRARARIIMDHFNTHFVPLFYRILVRCGRQLEPLAL
jgi:glutathione S-transferase